MPNTLLYVVARTLTEGATVSIEILNAFMNYPAVDSTSAAKNSDFLHFEHENCLIGIIIMIFKIGDKK